MKVTWYGHSCFWIESSAGTVAIDPFLTGNPAAPVSADQVRCDAIILSHGHADHVGDAAALANRHNAPIVAVFELATVLGWQGLTTHGQHIGGAHDYPFGRVKFTPAAHGTGMIDEAAQTITYTGQPASILYTVGDKTVFHAGDTALLAEFDLVGRRHNIDLALLPIGDNFTMGPDDAAEAVRMLRPKRVVPMHYNTWDLIAQDPAAFAGLVGGAAEVVILQPGEAIDL